MKPRYQYILALLIVAIVYEVYLIVFYNYKDFQINSYISRLESDNAKISRAIERKKENLALVRTSAFLDRMAKSSQNKKNPGEDAIFLVAENDVKDYKKLDPEKAFIQTAKPISKTAGMSNMEKWAYYLLRVDLRD